MLLYSDMKKNNEGAKLFQIKRIPPPSRHVKTNVYRALETRKYTPEGTDQIYQL